MSAPIRILLADDHPIVLNGLRNLILADDGLALVAEASSGMEALKAIREHRPDVAIVDISMPELNGIQVTRQVAKELPAVKVLILTLHEDRVYLRQAIDAGAHGYVLKRSAAENLVPAVRAILSGGLYVDPAITKRMFDSNPSRPGGVLTAGMAALTERECEVLRMIALGHTNKEIARRLDVGVKSVETYKARGAEKLGVKTRAELVRYAVVQGWLSNI